MKRFIAFVMVLVFMFSFLPGQNEKAKATPAVEVELLLALAALLVAMGFTFETEMQAQSLTSYLKGTMEQEPIGQALLDEIEECLRRSENNNGQLPPLPPDVPQWVLDMGSSAVVQMMGEELWHDWVNYATEQTKLQELDLQQQQYDLSKLMLTGLVYPIIIQNANLALQTYMPVYGLEYPWVGSNPHEEFIKKVHVKTTHFTLHNGDEYEFFYNGTHLISNQTKNGVEDQINYGLQNYFKSYIWQGVTVVYFANNYGSSYLKNDIYLTYAQQYLRTDNLESTIAKWNLLKLNDYFPTMGQKQVTLHSQAYNSIPEVNEDGEIGIVIPVQWNQVPELTYEQVRTPVSTGGTTPGGGGNDTENKPDVKIPSGTFAMFPFCIPWDVYNFFDALAVTPVTPRFEFTLFPASVTGKWGFETEPIVIDFEEFETPRQIVRGGFLILFIAGLIVVTRKYIWTGGG